MNLHIKKASLCVTYNHEHFIGTPHKTFDALQNYENSLNTHGLRLCQKISSIPETCFGTKIHFLGHPISGDSVTRATRGTGSSSLVVRVTRYPWAELGRLGIRATSFWPDFLGQKIFTSE